MNSLNNTHQLLESELAEDKWQDGKERLLLYADFMGFKSLVETKHHLDLKGKLTRFRQELNDRIEVFCPGDNLRFVQFSDSLLFVVDGVDERMFKLITQATICLMHVSMMFEFPLKGVIAQGEFSYDKEDELYLGKPLVDAYLLQEQVKYYGVVVHNSAEKTVKDYKSRLYPYVNTEVNIDKARVRHYHLCWNFLNKDLREDDLTDTCEVWLDTIAERVSGYPRIYIDNTIKIMRQDKDEVNLLQTNLLDITNEENQ